MKIIKSITSLLAAFALSTSMLAPTAFAEQERGNRGERGDRGNNGEYGRGGGGRGYRADAPHGYDGGGRGYRADGVRRGVEPRRYHAPQQYHPPHRYHAPRHYAHPRGYVAPRHYRTPYYYNPRPVVHSWRHYPGYQYPAYRPAHYYSPSYYRPVYRDYSPRWRVGSYYVYRPQTVVIYDYHNYGLYSPPAGYHWVHDHDSGDVILASIATGAIIALAIGLLD